MSSTTLGLKYLAVGCFVLALGVRALSALPIQQPGYMDAYYYYNVAEALKSGQGFTDHILWNYLDNPAGIPHPACLYWMPLTAALIYPFFLLFGASFRAAQIPFVLLSALVAVITYRVSLELSASRWQAALAAGLMVVSGFYTVYWVVTDSFAPFAVAGSLALFSAGRGIRDRRLAWFALSGLCAGLAHLTRADGILVLVAIVLAALWGGWRLRLRGKTVLAACALSILAYLAAMSPWLYRNWREMGTLMPSSGLQTVFLTNYDDLFAYGRELTRSSYLAWGWAQILNSKLQALWFGAQNLAAVNLMIFLVPLAVIGLWSWRRKAELMPVVTYGALLYATMTLVFSFPGVRGGLFHSSAVLLPWLFAAAAQGLDQLIGTVAERRASWQPGPARTFFFSGTLVLAALLSGFLYWRAVQGAPGTSLPWNERDGVYAEIGRWLGQNADAQAVVMVNNAPAFYYHTHHPSLSIPSEDLDGTLDAARRYKAEYLVLEYDHPRPLREVYEGNVADPRLELAATMLDGLERPVKIYRLETGR